MTAEQTCTEVYDCYTRAGYLWGLIALKTQLGITGSDVDEKIQNVANEVLHYSPNGCVKEM